MGCDSTVTLNLTMHPIYDQFVEAEICDGDSYEVGDSIYIATGVYPTLMSSIYGCDSLVTLNLTVHPVYAITIDTAICQGEVFEIGGESYTVSGTITTGFESIHGCDSLVQTNLNSTSNL